MKKLLTVFLVFLVLVGCAVEESPEYYFDTALTEIENLENFSTELTIKNSEDEILVTATFHQEEWHNESIRTNVSEGYDIDTKYITIIAKFAYASIFQNFSLEEQMVICDIPVDASKTIVETAQQLTGEDVTTITHYMYLADESLDYVDIMVETQTQTLTYTINLMDK